jgi:hypothetical protein
MFDMANDSGLFLRSEELENAGWTAIGNLYEVGEDRALPLFEAKMLHQYDNQCRVVKPVAVG